MFLNISDLVEFLEDCLLLGLGNPYSTIVDRNLDIRDLFIAEGTGPIRTNRGELLRRSRPEDQLGLDNNPAFVRGKLDGVAKNVTDRLYYAFEIASDQWQVIG